MICHEVTKISVQQCKEKVHSSDLVSDAEKVHSSDLVSGAHVAQLLLGFYYLLVGFIDRSLIYLPEVI